MSTHDDGGPAFPAMDGTLAGPALRFCGMSLRDYFAAKAMQALIGTRHADYQGEDGPETVAGDAYTMADAMLKERAK